MWVNKVGQEGSKEVGKKKQGLQGEIHRLPTKGSGVLSRDFAGEKHRESRHEEVESKFIRLNKSAKTQRIRESKKGT